MNVSIDKTSNSFLIFLEMPCPISKENQKKRKEKIKIVIMNVTRTNPFPSDTGGSRTKWTKNTTIPRYFLNRECQSTYLRRKTMSQ